MAKTATYNTTVAWKGDHWGHIVMGNGPQMMFSAPPDAYGHEGVLTPEDAFVASANTCVMMMFLWAAERFKLDLVSYTCRTEGTKRIELDRTGSSPTCASGPRSPSAPTPMRTAPLSKNASIAPWHPPRNTAWWRIRSRARLLSSRRLL